MSKTELPPALRWLLVRARLLEPDMPVRVSPNDDENSDRPSPLTLVAAVKPARRRRLKIPSPKSIRVELALVLVILGPFTTDDVPTVEAFSGDCSRQAATMFRTECRGDLGRSVTVPVSVERDPKVRLYAVGLSEGDKRDDIDGEEIRSVTLNPVLPKRVCLVGEEERDEALYGLGERGPIGADANLACPEA